MLKWMAINCLCVSLLSVSTFAAEAAKVERFTPSGAVDDPREVTVVFSQPMVALGEAAAAPFLIDCAWPGSGHWVDRQTWLYTFNAAFEVGGRCSFTLQPKLQTASGAEVGGKQVYEVARRAAQVVDVWPDPCLAVVEQQVFIVEINAIVDPEWAAAPLHHR